LQRRLGPRLQRFAWVGRFLPTEDDVDSLEHETDLSGR